MGLFKGEIKKINRDTLATTKYRLFNTNRIGELKADGTDSVLKYTKNFLDRRESADEYKLEETYAAVEGFWGGDDQELKLSVLKKKIDAKTIDYVDTITIGTDKVGFGWADPDDATKSWIEVYPNAFKKVLYQIDLSIDQLNGTANILTFQFLDADNAALSADAVGIIDYAAKTIAVEVPNGTTVTALVADFTLSSGAIALISTTEQVSGTTTNDFTNPVTFTINGANGETNDFVITVTIAA